MKFTISLFLFLYALPSFAIDWGYCQNGLAYQEQEMIHRKPEADKVCSLPTAKDSGDPDAVTGRCALKQQEVCMVGAGGLAEGENSVPREAYFQTRARLNDGSAIWVRCVCGCFSKDVLILTNQGWIPIGQMVEQNPSQHYRVAIPSFDGALSASDVLRQKDFTVGPEEKPILKLTIGDRSLTMTDSHPIMLLRDGKKDMVQAQAARIGDAMLGLDGQPQIITAIETLYLPSGDNKVFNIDTRGKTAADHLIGANGFMVGDVIWQNYLSTLESRASHLMGRGR